MVFKMLKEYTFCKHILGHRDKKYSCTAVVYAEL